MALTQGAWSLKTVNRRLVAACTISGTTAENDVYTLKTPKELDPSKPFTLVFDVTEDLTAAGAAALDIWGGHSDSFAMTGNDTTVAATDGALIVAITTDVDAGGVFAVRCVPGNEGAPAQVVTVPGAIVILPPLPYFAFNIDCTAALADAADVKFYIIQ
jgi:hypothetical protein